MSPDEQKKLRRSIGLLTLLVIVFIILSIASIVHNYIDPGNNSFPETISTPQVVVKEQKPIDQAELLEMIKHEIRQEISKVESGQNGQAGPSGNDGMHGQDGATGQSGQNGNDGLSAYDLWTQKGNTGTIDDFLASLRGQDGTNGVDGKTPEIKVNTLTGQLEMRFPGDRLWTVINGSCLNINICGVL